MNSPKLYSSFLLWMLAELFEQLPEVGDPEKPKLVFFFDEAHLLFSEAPKALTEKVEQVVRLIRSKGVGVYFVTQNPLDVPESVLGQLGNRVQHALRAFTPRDQKAVKTAADTLRPNPKLKAEKVITELGVGEALVSLLDDKGRPTIVERAYIVPPGKPCRAAWRRRAKAAPARLGAPRQVREDGGSRIRLREAEGARSGKAGCSRTQDHDGFHFKPRVRHPARQDRAARRPAIAGRARGADEKRGARHRLGTRPADHARACSVRSSAAAAAVESKLRIAPGASCSRSSGCWRSRFRPILIKLSYGAHPVSPVTLLFLRMILSLPFFLGDRLVAAHARSRSSTRARLGRGRRASAFSATTPRASSTSSACNGSAPGSAG